MASGRSTIKQRISLEGGKELEKQLKALGDVGEKAFEKIQAAAIKVDLAKFGASVKTFGSDLATVVGRTTLAVTALGTAASAAGVAMFSLAKSGAEAADAAGKAAEKTGLQVETYGRLAFAAEQADVSQEEFVAGMSRLNKAIAEAAASGKTGFGQLADSGKSAGSSIVQALGHTVQTFDDIGVRVTRFGSEVKKGTDKAAEGAKGAAAVFAALGVSVKDAAGRLRGTEDILGDVAEAFSRMPEGPQKAALAIRLFGRAGAELLPFLNEGRDGLRELGEQAERLGIIFTQQQAELGDSLGDALGELSKAIKGARDQLGLLFAPIILAGVETLRDFIIQNRDAILSFGRAAAQVSASVLADIVGALSGNDAAVQHVWILDWRDAIVAFGRDLAAVWNTVVQPIFIGIRAAAQSVADAINAIFGTEITGGQLILTTLLLQLLGVFKLFSSSVGVVISGLRLLATVFASLFSGGIVAAASSFFGTLVSGATAFLGLVAGLVGWPALIVAAVAAAGAAVVIFWDDITAAAQSAYDFIADLFSPSGLAGLSTAFASAGAISGEAFVEALVVAFRAVGGIFVALGELALGFVSGVVSALAGLAAELAPTWAQIQAAGTAVWGAIGFAAGQIWSGIVTGAQGVATLLLPIWQSIAAAGSAVWTTITAAAATAFATLATVIGTAVGAIGDTIGTVVTAAVEAFSGATDRVAEAAEAIGEAIQRATEAAGDIEGAEELAESLVEPFERASDKIDDIFSGIREMAANGFNAVRDEVERIADAIESMIDRIIDALEDAAAAAAALQAQAGSSSSSSSDSGLGGFAGGGHVRGPGTGTSDSILAWLSNNEFVMRAAAVRKYGPELMHALNSLCLPKDILKQLRGFSIGGLVQSTVAVPVPAFAGGGLVDLAPSSGGVSGQPLVLNFGAGDIFEVIAPADVADSLSRFMAFRATNSTGRKPGWKIR